MFCINCGKQLPDGSAFCQFCGSPVQAVAQQAPQQPVPQYAAPQQAVPQYAPVQQPVPQYAAPQQAVPQYAPQQAVPQYAAPQQAYAPAPQMAAGSAITLTPVAIGLVSPKNAAGEKAHLEAAAMWYVEITNNQLVFSTQGNVASYMFGAIGALASMASGDLKPSFFIEAQNIRDIRFEKKLGGQVIIIELLSGKLLQVKAKIDVLNTIDSWWRLNTHR